MRIGKAGEWFSREKYGLAFAVALMLVVGFVYFGIEGNAAGMGPKEKETAVFSGIKLKLAFNDKGEAKIFALASNNALAKYKTSEGNPIPEDNSMVLGATEAETMKSEKLFGKAGDKISLFGISTSIEGVLGETGTVADYFHFVSQTEFEKIDGIENKIFVKMSDAEPELFYTYKTGEELPSILKLKEGNLSDYEEHVIVGEKYYPMILGSDEAAAMQKDGDFKKLGDSIVDFNRKFIVAGAMEKTGTALDLAHFVPLDSSALGRGA